RTGSPAPARSTAATIERRTASQTAFASSSDQPSRGWISGYSSYPCPRISPSVRKTIALHPVVPISIPSKLIATSARVRGIMSGGRFTWNARNCWFAGAEESPAAPQVASMTFDTFVAAAVAAEAGREAGGAWVDQVHQPAPQLLVLSLNAPGGKQRWLFSADA